MDDVIKTPIFTRLFNDHDIGWLFDHTYLVLFAPFVDADLAWILFA